MRAYGQSKFAMIAAGFLRARRLDPRNVTVNRLHPPTYMPTKMVLDSIGYSIDSLDEGRDATMRLILYPDLRQVTGEFLDRKRTHTHADTYDEHTQQVIWDLSTRLTTRHSANSSLHERRGQRPEPVLSTTCWPATSDME